MLGLLYEGKHLSLSVRRKITVNFFYSTFTNAFYFCHVFLRFLTFSYFLGNVFFIYAPKSQIGQTDRQTDGTDRQRSDSIGRTVLQTLRPITTSR